MGYGACVSGGGCKCGKGAVSAGRTHLGELLEDIEPLAARDVPMPSLLNLSEDPRLDQRATREHHRGDTAKRRRRLMTPCLSGHDVLVAVHDIAAPIVDRVEHRLVDVLK